MKCFSLQGDFASAPVVSAIFRRNTYFYRFPALGNLNTVHYAQQMTKIGSTYYTTGGANFGHVSETYFPRYDHADLGRLGDPSLIRSDLIFFFSLQRTIMTFINHGLARNASVCTATIVSIYQLRTFIHTFHLRDSIRQINVRRLAVTQAIRR